MSKYQTIANAEEQHLAAMSTTTSITTTKKVKKVSNKSTLKKTLISNVSVESETTKEMENVSAEIQQQQQQQTTSNRKTATKMVTKSETATTAAAAATTITMQSEQHSAQTPTLKDDSIEVKNAEIREKKKTKSKKNKKPDSENQNISVKSSFSKFDALQKRNLIHVRSSDAGKAQEKFSNPQEEKVLNCRLCSKPVYKMEEVKAEKSIYHKNCFRCHECSKQLKVDNYQSHEGVPYCMIHFKLLFAPKTVEETEPEKPRKPELIIRENQPEILPPDVVRASDKPDLGLEDLQQLNVRSRFQVFENHSQRVAEEYAARATDARPANVKRSTSILSKLAKLQAHGFSGSINGDDIAEHAEHNSSSENEESADSSCAEDDDVAADGDDVDLVRSKKRTRERPLGIGKAMDDIKTKFENGPLMSKDERREERKQEIQNIRSRLFMGKQARIKEMYQQAVAESEQAIISAGKKPDVEVDGVTRSLKERFEKGDIFKAEHVGDENEESGPASLKGLQSEADVFESAISKQSRSIFMELDANMAAGKNQAPSSAKRRETQTMSQRNQQKRTNSECEQEDNVVKCDDKPDDVKIETSEISQKFKFFETYRPKENRRKEFRMTPPREGVVKMPSPETDQQQIEELDVDADADTHILEKSRTTAKMLDKFREMEQNKNKQQHGPRPLKCFTPPPDGGRRMYQAHDSEQDTDDEEEEVSEEEYDDDEDNEVLRRAKLLADDEALKEAQAAARAKQLRAKFEKWEADEIRREMHEGRVDIYSQQVSDDTNIESTKSIRDRFENMKNSEPSSPARPRYQVNRFV